MALVRLMRLAELIRQDLLARLSNNWQGLEQSEKHRLYPTLHFVSGDLRVGTGTSPTPTSNSPASDDLAR